jgi:hypothetical protein
MNDFQLLLFGIVFRALPILGSIYVATRILYYFLPFPTPSPAKQWTQNNVFPGLNRGHYFLFMFINGMVQLCMWSYQDFEQGGMQEVFTKERGVKLGMVLTEIIEVGIMFSLFDWEEYRVRTWRQMSQEAFKVSSAMLNARFNKG